MQASQAGLELTSRIPREPSKSDEGASGAEMAKGVKGEWVDVVGGIGGGGGGDGNASDGPPRGGGGSPPPHGLGKSISEPPATLSYDERIHNVLLLGTAAFLQFTA